LILFEKTIGKELIKLGESLIMSKLKLFFIATFVCITAFIVMTYVILLMSQKSQIKPAIEHAKLTRDANLKERLSRPYGKLEIPAEVYVDLLEPENPRKAAEMIISASTAIHVRSGRIILLKSREDSEPESKEILWSGKSDGLIDRTILYKAGLLPEGKYQYTAVLEFETEGNASSQLIAAGSLYLDVKKSGILSSNVSFDQIYRDQLYKELVERVLADMKPQLKNANSKVLDQEIIALENAEPGIIDRKIKELIDSDPDIARKAQELNTFTEKPVEFTESMELSSQNQQDTNSVSTPGGPYSPVFDGPVPVPEEFKK
jgi:hypothetical protein